MNNSLIIGLIVVAASGFGLWKTGLLEQWTDDSGGAIPACEESLKELLLAPSSYSRGETTFLKQPLPTLDGFKVYRMTQGCVGDTIMGPGICVKTNVSFIESHIDTSQDKVDNVANPIAKRQKAKDIFWAESFEQFKQVSTEGAIVAINYEANNGYGAQIAQLHICEFGRSLLGEYRRSDIYLPDYNVKVFAAY